MERLKRRRDFLNAAKGRKWASPGLVLQARDRADGKAPRIGYTVTKRIGNAPQRNRVRRRLREAARLVMVDGARAGFDYVVIGRQTTAARDFADLQGDFRAALAKVHGSQPTPANTPVQH